MHCDTELTHTVSKGVFNISEAAKGSYCSSHDERGYHTANLLKRDALPTDNSADSGFLDRPCSHPSAVTSYNRENRSPQKGDLAVKNRLRTGAATAPLLRRYRLCEPLQKEGTPKNHGSGALGTGQGTWASPHDALPNVSTIFSPIQIPRLIEGRNLEKSCNSAHRPTRTRKGMNPRLAKQTVVPSGHVLNTHEPRGCDLNVEGNCGSGIAPSCPTCSDANCIHGREGILDYVKMQYELRACRGALHEKDVELERLQQRLASAEAEMLSTVSRFERKIMEMEEHHKQPC
ncbi:unnamed protein product [Trypanosoma congolense IL3000]|uniref:WGS project CAEQ00000000 data, annotated contig 1174 n=1 Tax=Trypanosoma congolense (strain IL3000) TaxID=1068625 RepID=F9W4E5_TRYCI|nr:unnamed protein product [Trypanosoma congolense IL3000]